MSRVEGPRLLAVGVGALIHVHNSAVRYGSAADIARLNRGEEVDPAAIYFRCSLRFSTASEAWGG